MDFNDPIQKAAILQNSPLFKNLLPEEIDMLSELIQRQELKAGESLYEQGDEGSAVYSIVQGSVDVVVKDNKGVARKISTLTAPDFFGEMSLIDKELRSATIQANMNTTLFFLTNKNIHSFARAYRNGFTWIVVNIARTLSLRLRETNRNLLKQMN